MLINKKGKIIETKKDDNSFNGKSAQDWSLKIVREDNTPGLYIYYSSPISGKEGYDDWFEDQDILEKNLEYKIKEYGWKIQWE